MNAKTGTLTLVAALAAVGTQADSFGSGANAFTLDFVNIGYAGNAGDTANTVNGANPGAVGYNYQMGMHEVTINQFAKARAADSRIGDGDENPYAIGVNGAASRTSWHEGAKFSNWLTTGDAYTGAYQFDGVGTLTNVNRAAAVSVYGTVYVLPTEDEWYKAAYLKADGSAYTLYATGDSIPGVETDANYGGSGGTYSTPWNVGTGNAENNGTFDMNGNVWEWNESASDGTLDNMTESRVVRGGSFVTNESLLRSSLRGSNNPSSEFNGIGFRVAAIPEPSSIAMVGIVSGLGLFIRRRLMM